MSTTPEQIIAENAETILGHITTDHQVDPAKLAQFLAKMLYEMARSSLMIELVAGQVFGEAKEDEN